MRFAAEQPAAGRGLTQARLAWRRPDLDARGLQFGRPRDAERRGRPRSFARSAGGRPPVGETMGTGPVRVGMILPLTQNGAPSPIGVSMRNAAQLAISNFGSTSITLMIQDDHSTADGAAQAAQSELGAGAQLILGPVFANDVRTASAAAKAAGRPMIAFSTDVTVAAPGVYLLSFLIQGYVDRILQYAVSSGKKSFGILAPQNDYGNVAAQRFQEMAGNVNAQVVVTARYSSGQIATAAGRWRRSKVKSTLCSFPSRRTPCRQSRARSGRPTSRPSFWEPASGTTRGCSNCRKCRARGSPPRQFRLRRLRAALQGQVQQRSGAPRDARL